VGAATVILAMGDGKRAAKAIDAYLAGTWPPPDDTSTVPADRATRTAGAAAGA
jgi:hypothetical protein